MSLGNVGENIKTRRKYKKMTQKELADRTDISEAMVSYIETGVKSVSVKTLYLISKALDCTTDDLLKENKKM